jgi:excisionase family DNA binding protein
MKPKALDDMPDLLTVEETISILRVGRNTTYEAIRQGVIPSIRLGRNIRIPKKGLLELLAPVVTEAPHETPEEKRGGSL